MHAIAHGVCTDTVRESAPKVDSGRKIPCRTWGFEPSSVLRLDFQSDAPATELSPPTTAWATWKVNQIGLNTKRLEEQRQVSNVDGKE